MKKTAIEIDNISKSYILGSISSRTFGEDFELFYKKLLGIKNSDLSNIVENDLNSYNNEKRIWALNNVSLNINQGEIIGIIGNNGAGKSTLLKILSRITSPTKGIVNIRGKIASLLEVGTGFHPDLTGRENIFLNGAIMGMSKKEIQQKLGSIIEFSGIEKFIDTPVKRYSSGMRVRLGFSVAAHLEPDILLVDEVLAVGDAEFQKKCIGKMKKASRGEGRTILFVSHNLSAINNLCERAIVLRKGIIEFDGKPRDATDYYINFINERKKSSGTIKFNSDEKKPIQLTKLELHNINGSVSDTFDFYENVFLFIDILIRNSNQFYRALVVVIDTDGNWVFSSFDNEISNSSLENLKPGRYVYNLKFPSKILKPGIYHIRISLLREKGKNTRIHSSESELSFEIIDTSSKRIMKEGYNSRSIIAPEIDWTLTKKSST